MNPLGPNGRLPSRPRRPGSAARGSTLFELVVVLVILAAVTAVAVPRFNSLIAQDQLERAARELTDNIRLVRSMAVRDRIDQDIYFDTAQQRYGIPGLPARQPEDDFYYVTFEPPLTLDTVEFGLESTLSFNRLGVPRAAGYVRITDGQATICLTVSPLTGEVTRSYQRGLEGGTGEEGEIEGEGASGEEASGIEEY